MMDCGFGQGLHCVWKPTHYFAHKEDLIVNNFANQPMNFTDNATASVCQAEAAWEQECISSDKEFKRRCRRSCLMAKRRGKVDYGFFISAPCSIVYDVSKRATAEMKEGPGKTREGEPLVPGRDVTVVRLEEGEKVQNLRDIGQALLKAIESNDLPQVHSLLAGNHAGGLEAKDDLGQTPISLAAERGQLEVVKALAALKADLEAKDLGGRTPIYRAAYSGQLEVVKGLAALKADFEARDGYGNKLIDWAYEHGQLSGGGYSMYEALYSMYEAKNKGSSKRQHLA